MTLDKIMDAVGARKSQEYPIFVEKVGKKNPALAFIAGVICASEVSTMMTVVGAINAADDVENPKVGVPAK